MGDDYTWVTGNDSNLEYKEKIDKGGFGTVHKVSKYVRPEIRANGAWVDPQ